jgi:phage terminase small subunit
MNYRKPKLLKLFQGTFRQDREVNKNETEMLINDDILARHNLKGEALDLWNNIVPLLEEKKLIGKQDQMLLDQVFTNIMLDYKCLEDIDKLEGTILTNAFKTDKQKLEKERRYSAKLNDHLKLDKQISLDLGKLGFTPSNRAYIPSGKLGSSEEDEDSNNLDDFIKKSN